jgi:protein SCO1
MTIRLQKTVTAICAVVMLIVLADPVLADGPLSEIPQNGQPETSVYSCPMDPEIRSTSPAKCPKCGMELQQSRESNLTPAENAANALALTTRPDGSISGMRIPDVQVVDQDGRRFRFFTDLVKGRTVAINFMFTTCTTICPPLAVTFARVQQELGDAVGNDVLLISVSVDPVTDIPPRMKAYMAKFGARPGWLFVGGSKPDIDALLGALGAYVSDKNDHTPMILIGNEKAGFWTRAFGLAPAGKLASLINEAKQKVRKN